MNEELAYFIFLLHFLGFVHEYFEVYFRVFAIGGDNEIGKFRYRLLIVILQRAI